ncbi:MAG: Excinuclease ABC C subunit domain protein [Parcubacteria group bacterium GW2011_GWC2_38_7]|nr:MAG: Excinuclease ABC C subunit domain protein [Parcubacteria group bacterium GW2011_GWC2_38_7]
MYILICSDNSYYVGVTNNIERRITSHRLGANVNSYTYKRRPVKLVYSEYYYYINDAIAREKQIKGWRRSKKEALINQNYEELYRLSNLNNRLSPSVNSG